MSNKISDEELIEEIHRLYDELGKVPTFRDMKNYGRFSGTIYHKRFGSWNEALIKSGLEPGEEKDIQRKEMEAEMVRLSEALGRSPTFRDMNRYGNFSPGVYQREYGSWNEALEGCGFVPNAGGGSEIPTEYLVKEFEDVCGEVGRPPTMYEMDEFGFYSSRTYVDRFGSWIEATRECGFEPRKAEDWVPSGSDHPLWKGGHRYNYGPSWEDAREEVVERDLNRCQRCGLDREEHIDRFGRELDVHHIIPFREFGTENHQDANRLTNLILLCRSCHRKIEGGKVECPPPPPS